MLTLSLGEKLGLHSINLLNKVMGCVKHSRKFSHGNKWDVAFQRVKKVNCCFSPDIGPIQIRQAFGWRAATNIHFRCLLVLPSKHPVRWILLPPPKAWESESPEKESNLPEVTQLQPLHRPFPLIRISLLLPPTDSYSLFRYLLSRDFLIKPELNPLARLNPAVQFSPWLYFPIAAPSHA